MRRIIHDIRVAAIVGMAVATAAFLLVSFATRPNKILPVWGPGAYETGREWHTVTDPSSGQSQMLTTIHYSDRDDIVTRVDPEDWFPTQPSPPPINPQQAALVGFWVGSALAVTYLIRRRPAGDTANRN